MTPPSRWPGWRRPPRDRAAAEPGPAEPAEPAEPTLETPADDDWQLDPPVDPTLVLFESHEGRGALCSPLAIYRALRADPRFDHLRFAWSLVDEDAVREARRALADDVADGGRTRYLLRDSPDFRRAATAARWLVNNHGFPSWFATRPEQTYVNTWHGVPLKLIGFDVRDGALAIRSTLRNFLNADVLVSAGPAMTERLYHGAYRLADLHGGTVLEIGTPRIDDQLHADPVAVRERLARLGVRVDPDRTVVLLAPTWRGRNFRRPEDDAAPLARRLAVLQEALGPRHQVLLKPHHVTAAAVAANAPELAGVLVPPEVPANELLAVVDVLVSDYSSLIVDALATDLPVVLHRPDEDGYRRARGLYPEPDLPGPATRLDADLAAVLTAVGTGSERDPQVSHADAYARWKQRWAPHEDGRASRRLIDAVFTGRPLPDPPRPARTRVLVYLGGLKPNGITTAALALVRGLDPERYAVFAHCEYKRDEQDWARVDELPGTTVPLIRTGPLEPPAADKACLDAWLADPAVAPQVAARARQVLEYEWRRCFGRSRFDRVIEFDGYAPLWAAKLAVAPGAVRAIWQHNEMAAEAGNTAKRDRPWLRRVFDRYADYDAIVSVSPTLRDRNAAALATPATRDRFVHVPNLLDAARVRRLAHGPASDAAAGAPPGPGGWAGLAELVGRVGAPAVREEVTRLELLRRTAPEPDQHFTFVTLGRLSAEKAQQRLLEAFARVRPEAPHARLLIAGDGELRPALTAAVRALDLVDAVRLLGHLPNPYPVLAAADCFVLSSDYEGLPMTVLEARLLGVPVLCTRFATAGDAVPPGTGLLVERTVDALADGLRTALRREVPQLAFDADAWNAAALDAWETVFTRATGGRGPLPSPGGGTPTATTGR